MTKHDRPDPTTATFELSQGTHDDGSPGSSLAIRGGVLTLDVQHCGDYDEAFETEPERAVWFESAVERALASTDAELSGLEVRLQPDYSGELYRAWLVELLATRMPATLRSLYWGSSGGSCFVEIPSFRALLEALPNLECLRLQGDWHDENAELVTSGPCHALQTLGLNALSVEAIDALIDLELSAIEHIELWLYDHENEGADLLTIEDLRPVFQAPLPALRRLTLHACEFGPELLAALPDAPFFESLQELNLLGVTIEGSYLDASCAEVLLSSRYARIPSIDVAGSFSDPRRDPSSPVGRLTDESSNRIRARSAGSVR